VLIITLGTVVSTIVGLAVGIVVGIYLRKMIAEAKIKNAEEEAAKIIDDAKKTI
jgi:ribonucrease Y